MKCRPLEKGMANHFSILALRTHVKVKVNSMKRQKDITLKDESPQVSRCPLKLEKSREITPEKMKRLNQNKKDTQL